MTQRRKMLRLTKKAALVEYALAMKSIGQQMSNACFNLAQRETLKPSDRQTLRDLWHAWDARLRPDRVGGLTAAHPKTAAPESEGMVR